MLIDTRYNNALREGYCKLEQTIVQAQGFNGCAYPPIMVSMTELARKYHHDGEPKRALDVINAALDAWRIMTRRYAVLIS